MRQSYQSLALCASTDENFQLEPLLPKHAKPPARHIELQLDDLWSRYGWYWLAADAIDHPASIHAKLPESEKKALRAVRYATHADAKNKYLVELNKEPFRRSKDPVAVQVPVQVVPFAKPLQLDALSITTAHQHFYKVHAGQTGIVVLWHAKDIASRWRKVKPFYALLSTLLEDQHDKNDRYMSVSEFNSWRVVASLHSLRALFVDIDGCVDLDYCLQQVAISGLPQPTFAMLTGRGIHLYWMINPAGIESLPLWQRLQVYIGKTLHAAGLPVDLLVRDCTRVLRIAGSINSKNGQRVFGKVVSDVTFDIKELADLVLGTTIKKEEEEKYKKGLDADVRRDAQVRDFRAAQVRSGIQPRTPPKNAAQGGIYGWWQLVYKDLITIGDQLGGIPKGHRDIYLFLYCVALSWFADPEALETEAFLVAKKMMPGFKEGEIKKAIAPNVKRAAASQAGKTVTWNGQEKDSRYWYKRETMVTLLSDIIEPSMYASLRALVPDEIRDERKAERDAARWADSNAENVRVSNIQKSADARALRAAGKTYKEIAGELDVAFNTVYRWCNSTH